MSSLHEQLKQLPDDELKRAYMVPQQYFYESTPRPKLPEHTWKHWRDQNAKEATELDRKRAAEAEARIMGTDNLAHPTILGIDPAADYPGEWDANYDDHQPQGATTMNLSTAIFLVSDEVRAVRVQYDPNDPGAKDYMFKTLDTTIAKDDLVVVPTSTRAGFTVCKVTEVDCQVDFDNSIQYKWCAKFDRASFDALLAQEQGILDRIAKAEQTRKRHELAASLKLDEQGLTGLSLLAAPSEPPPNS